MRFCLLLLLVILFSCSDRKAAEEKLIADNMAWRQKRLNELLGEEGWVNLSGLFWLKQGVNSFGSDQANDIIFPEGKISKKAGYFVLNGTNVKVHLLGEDSIMVDGVRTDSATVFSTSSENAPLVTLGSLHWKVIKRGDKIGVRLRDFEHPALNSFQGLEYFDIDSKWRVHANVDNSPGRKIPMTNVLGQTMMMDVMGTLKFELNGQEFEVDAVNEEGDLFVIFSDPTNGESTYGSGRYLHVTVPNPGEDAIVDFNRCYNPPCAFTGFATCLLPPKKNIFPIKIEAGEKAYDLHH